MSVENLRIMRNNIHYYEEFKTLVEIIAVVEDNHFQYFKTFHNLQEFDQLVKKLSYEEEKMHTEGPSYKHRNFDDDFFKTGIMCYITK